MAVMVVVIDLKIKMSPLTMWCFSFASARMRSFEQGHRLGQDFEIQNAYFFMGQKVVV